MLTPGNTSDIKAAELLKGHVTRFRRLVADRGYDANSFRKTLKEAGTTPIIPGRINRKRRIRHDEKRYRDRWLIEAMFCRLKTSAASPHATTSWPPTSSPPQPSPPSSPSGSD